MSEGSEKLTSFLEPKVSLLNCLFCQAHKQQVQIFEKVEAKSICPYRC